LVQRHVQVGRLGPNGVVSPLLANTGDNVEGAVYGAIYLDLARTLGLREVVGLVLNSNQTNFDNFRQYVIGLNNPTFTAAINQVRGRWSL
jgi:hypothetical protein